MADEEELTGFQSFARTTPGRITLGLIPGFNRGFAMAEQQQLQRDQRDREAAHQDFTTLRQLLDYAPDDRDILFDDWAKRKGGGKIPPHLDTLKKLIAKGDEDRILLLKDLFDDIGQGIADGSMSTDQIRQIYRKSKNPHEAYKMILQHSEQMAARGDIARLQGAQQIAPPQRPAQPQPPQYQDPGAQFFAQLPANYVDTPPAGTGYKGPQPNVVSEGGQETFNRPPLTVPPLIQEAPPVQEPKPQSALDILRQRRTQIDNILVTGQQGMTFKQQALDRLDKQIAEMTGFQTETGKLQRDRDVMIRDMGMAEGSPAVQAIDRQIAKAGRQAAESPAGKAGDDLARAEALYGRDSVQYRAVEAQLKTGGEPVKLSDVNSVRGQFTQLSGNFRVMADAYSKVLQIEKEPSAAGDVALIFHFMHIIEPTSAVKEGEFATAQNSAGVPERVRGLYNRLLTGERLTDEQRADFIKQSKAQFASARRAQIGLEKQYQGIAERAGMDPKDVAVDFLLDLRHDAPTEKKPATAPPGPAGKAPAKPADVDAARKRLGLD